MANPRLKKKLAIARRIKESAKVEEVKKPLDLPVEAATVAVEKKEEEKKAPEKASKASPKKKAPAPKRSAKVQEKPTPKASEPSEE